MLSDNEIDTYYDSVYTHFISKNQDKIKMSDNWLKASCLMNDENRLIGISKVPMTVKSLCDFRHYPVYSFFMIKQENYDIWVEKNKSWKFSHDVNNRVWNTSTSIQSIEELKDYILLNQKINLLDRIHGIIEQYRSEWSKLLDGQSSIYICKYIEAKDILEKNIVEDELMVYPFITGYANTKGVSLTQAAKEVVLQYQIQSGFLSETENIRIKYTNIIRKETDIVNLIPILEDFQTESYRFSFL
jgi:cell fate (sporulation/competence/biofilm development) regulator YmcA (YheA/YmcA/DUF963 family)